MQNRYLGRESCIRDSIGKLYERLTARDGRYTVQRTSNASNASPTNESTEEPVGTTRPGVQFDAQIGPTGVPLGEGVRRVDGCEDEVVRTFSLHDS